MHTLEWGPAMNGICESEKFASFDALVEFADRLTDVGDWVVIIDDEAAYGDYIPEIVEELVEQLKEEDE